MSLYGKQLIMWSAFIARVYSEKPFPSLLLFSSVQLQRSTTGVISGHFTQKVGKFTSSPIIIQFDPVHFNSVNSLIIMILIWLICIRLYRRKSKKSHEGFDSIKTLTETSFLNKTVAVFPSANFIQIFRKKSRFFKIVKEWCWFHNKSWRGTK